MDVCSFCGCRLRLGYLTDRAVFVILTPRFLRFAVPVCVLQVGFVSQYLPLVGWNILTWFSGFCDRGQPTCCIQIIGPFSSHG